MFRNRFGELSLSAGREPGKARPYCVTPAVEALEQRIVPVVLPGLDIANVDVVQGLLLPALTSLRLPEQAQKDVITDVVAAAKNIPMSGPATDTLSMSLFAAVIDLAAADLPMYRKDQAEFAANVGDALLMSDSMMNLTMAQTEFMSLGDMNAKLGGFALSQKDAAVVMQSYSTLTMFVLTNGGITQENKLAVDFVTSAAALAAGQKDAAGTALLAVKDDVVNLVQTGAITPANAVPQLQAIWQIGEAAGLGLHLSPVVLISPIPSVPEKGEATLNALVVTFNGESLTDADISWGDKKHKTTDGVITSQGNGVFSITGAHVYKKEGSFTVTLTVTFEDASTASATGTVTVTERHDGEKPDRDSDRG